jgi:hypothetical protein
LTKPRITATSIKSFLGVNKNSRTEESHIVLGYVDVVAATTIVLL